MSGGDTSTLDLAAAATFLKRLAPDGKLTFQTFDDTRAKRRHLNRVLHGSLDRHACELTRLNAAGAGVFVMVNRGDLKARTTKSVTQVRALFLDLDGAPLEPVRSAAVAPHLVTETSPGRFHAYWCVDTLALGQFKAMQQALAEAFGGDPKVCDLPRVMRLPGFYHRKRSAFMVRLIECTGGPPRSGHELLEQLGADTPTIRPDYQHGHGTPPSRQFAKLDYVHLEHENYLRLSPLARTLLLELVKQYNGFNNGDLTLAPATLKQRGLELGKRTIWRARDELLACGWVVYTRTRPRQCYLLALTFKPIDACNGKHDAVPTSIAPDLWKQPPDESRCSLDTSLVRSHHQHRQSDRHDEAA
ncbi:virulence-associated E protein [Salinisphaera shabanensis E1L3A]|uniref:Virulence-associated E protein n=1 Tax=Salinisphaera shabanensis E1L3A TaxID=1033802 RepID=U2ERU8_9GAMM|nr:virulence-associated protein E [Salinisphaera shabanensis]ERJ20722.1 virulence-associated E protein [Salinisphaera shabanensis E1L3A]